MAGLLLVGVVMVILVAGYWVGKDIEPDDRNNPPRNPDRDIPP